MSGKVKCDHAGRKRCSPSCYHIKPHESGVEWEPCGKGYSVTCVHTGYKLVCCVPVKGEKR
jgi:hypothetical protein